MWRSTLLAVLLLTNVFAAGFASELNQQLNTLAERHKGQVSIFVKHLKTGESFQLAETRPMPTASLIKVAVMIAAYRQADRDELDLDKMLELEKSDQVPGSGVLTPHFSAGTRLSVRDAIRLMISHSDNTATNLVLDEVGIETVNQTMNQLDCGNTRIHAKVFRRDTSVDPQRSREFGLGSTTAAEMASLFQRLYDQTIASRKSCAAMMQHLRSCQDRSKLSRLLRAGSQFAHKSGSVSAVRCDAGILETPGGAVLLCVLTAKNEDKSWANANAAERLCAEVGQAVQTHFHPTATSNLDRDLREGASGRMVEALQRTLNARMDPSPELSVDGDFGPNTRSAVTRFQADKGLKTTGVVDSSTWNALGTLLMKEQPVPEPDVVNNEVLPKQQADSLQGQPFVSAKSWAIADGQTGEVLWGSNQNQARHMASTT